MTEADLHLSTPTNFVILFGQSMSLCGLMESHCLTGIRLHATGTAISSQLNIHNTASSCAAMLSMAL